MEDRNNLKDKVAKGVLWGGLSNGMQQLLNLVIGIFLARILTPADYGIVGVLTVFSALAAALQEGGFISALTNVKNDTPLYFSSVFWFSLCIGVSFYVLLFFLAPLIARFYDMPELTHLSRFIFIGFVFSCFGIVPRAILFKNIKAKESAQVMVISLSVAGVTGVVLALNGYAYWALAWQTVVFTFSHMALAYIYTRWHPTLQFSMAPIRQMLGYSSKIVVTNVFNILNNNIFAVLLGKFYSARDVGDFNQANKWNLMGYSLISGIMNGVAQPALAKVVDDGARQVQVFRKMLRFTAFISFPLMLGLSLTSRDFIVIAIGEKWLLSAAILQLLCVWGAFYPVSQLFANLLLSQGRSKAFMWVTITLSVTQICAVYFSFPYGLYRMLYVFIAINIGWTLVWYLQARRRIRLTLAGVLKDILPFLGVAAISYGCSYLLFGGIGNIYAAFFAKAAGMVAFYLVILWVLNARILKESIGYIREKILKRKPERVTEAEPNN